MALRKPYRVFHFMSPKVPTLRDCHLVTNAAPRTTRVVMTPLILSPKTPEKFVSWTSQDKSIL